MINAEKLEELKILGDGSNAFVIEMLDKFVERSAEQLDTAEHLLADNQIVELGKVVHGLKGATLSLGLDAMSELLVGFDRELKSGDVGPAADHIKKLKIYLADVKTYRDSLS